MDLSRAIITDHATGQMAKRQIEVEEVMQVLVNPLGILSVRPVGWWSTEYWIPIRRTSRIYCVYSWM